MLADATSALRKKAAILRTTENLPKDMSLELLGTGLQSCSCAAQLITSTQVPQSPVLGHWKEQQLTAHGVYCQCHLRVSPLLEQRRVS